MPQARTDDDIAWMLERLYTRQFTGQTAPAGRFWFDYATMRVLWRAERLTLSRRCEPLVAALDFGLSGMWPPDADPWWAFIAISDIRDWPPCDDDWIAAACEAVVAEEPQRGTDYELAAWRMQWIFRQAHDQSAAPLRHANVSRDQLRTLAEGNIHVSNIADFSTTLNECPADDHTCMALRLFTMWGNELNTFAVARNDWIRTWRRLKSTNPTLADVDRELWHRP
jgi:hypothetical protein